MRSPIEILRAGLMAGVPAAARDAMGAVDRLACACRRRVVTATAMRLCGRALRRVLADGSDTQVMFAPHVTMADVVAIETRPWDFNTGEHHAVPQFAIGR